MVSYRVRVIWNATWSFIKDQARIWGRGLAKTVAALITILVTDNILSFTYGSFYRPAAYGAGIIAILILAYSRNKRWGPSFKKSVLRIGAWILGIVAVVLLQFEKKDLTYFDPAQSIPYNLLVALAAVVLVFGPWIFTVMSDLLRDLHGVPRGSSQKRVPTIFISEYIVDDPTQSLFDRFVAILQN